MKYRLDLFSTSLLLDSGKGGRKAFRKSLAEEKNKSRDHEFDNFSSSDVDGRDARGVGSANRKFLVRSAQRESQLSNQQFEAEIVRLNIILRSKSGTRDARLRMFDAYTQSGQMEKAEAAMASAEAVIEEIEEVEKQLLQLQNKSVSGGSK